MKTEKWPQLTCFLKILCSEVSKEEGETLAKQYNMKFFEVRAYIQSLATLKENFSRADQCEDGAGRR